MLPKLKPSSTGYAALVQDEEARLQMETEQHARRKSRHGWLNVGAALLKTTVVLFAAWGVLAALNLLLPSTDVAPPALISLTDAGYLRPPHPRSCRCGSTLTEARARNCSYDSLAAAWLPQHCIDHELLREWEVAGSGPGGQWEYFADRERRRPLTLQQVAELPDQVPGNRLFYTSMEWHIKHCSFGWRKQYRSAATGVIMDHRSDGVHHIAHCEMMFLKRNDLQELVTEVGVALDADEGEL